MVKSLNKLSKKNQMLSDIKLRFVKIKFFHTKSKDSLDSEVGYKLIRKNVTYLIFKKKTKLKTTALKLVEKLILGKIIIF